jgi:hypothetical protein
VSYSLGSGSISNYDYALRWYIDLFEEPLPLITSFTMSRNMSFNTNDVLENQYNKICSSTNSNNLLPLSVRYVDKFGSYCIERPPFKVKINYKNARAAYNGTVVDDLEIWVPWTLMIIPSTFSLDFDPTNIGLYYSSEPLDSKRDQYINSLLPNTYAHGGICWSQSFQKLISMDKSRDDSSSFDFTYWHSMILNDYMMGGWNNDLQSANLNAITQHQYSHSSTYNTLFRRLKSIDTDEECEAYLLNKYPFLHKYIHMEKYPDLQDKVRGILINKFHIYKNYADMLTDFNYVIPNRKKKPKYDEAVGHTYSKLLAFLSVCSLSDTLQFYSNVSGYLSELNTSFNRYTHSFSRILSEYKSNFGGSLEGSKYPIMLPFTSLSKNNVDLVASSTSCYKSLTVYYAIDNITLSKLNNYMRQRTIPSRDIFKIFNVDPNVFFPLIDDYMNNSNKNKIYIKIDSTNDQLSIVDKKYFIDLSDNTAVKIQQKIAEYSRRKSKNRYCQDYLGYVDTKEKILDSLNISY